MRVDLTQAVRAGASNSRLYATLTSENAGGADNSLWQWMRIIRATTLYGGGTADVTPSGQPRSTVDVTVPQATVSTTAPLVLKYAATIPAAGPLTVNAFSLNLYALTPDGAAITDLSSAQTPPDSDGSPNTWDMPCTLNGGPVRLNTTPTPTPTPTVTPTPKPTPTPLGTPPVIDTPAPGGATASASALATCQVPVAGTTVVKIDRPKPWPRLVDLASLRNVHVRERRRR